MLDKGGGSADKERRLDGAGARTFFLTLLQPHVLMPILVVAAVGGVWLSSGGGSAGGSDLEHFHEMRLARHRTGGGGGRDENVVAMSAAEARQRREHEPLPPAAPDDAELQEVTGGKVKRGEDGEVDCFQFSTCAACREHECGWCLGDAWCVKDEPNICQDQVICRSHACCSHTRIPRVLLTPPPTCPRIYYAFLTRARVSAANYQFDHIGFASEQLECPKDGVTQKQIEANLIKSLRANKILPPDEPDGDA